MSPLNGVKREKIKITGLKVISLGYRLKPEEEWPDGDQNFIIWKTEPVIIEVKSDAGITGLGRETVLRIETNVPRRRG